MEPFDLSLLRESVPVFPLPNCVLLPGAVLPLHVFEPRYRFMARDLLVRPPGKRLIAVALLRDDFETLYETNRAPIQPTVGVGQVVRHTALDDGRFNLLVLGRARARIAVDDTSGIYRKAQLTFVPTEPSNILSSVDDSVDRVRILLKEFADVGLCEPGLIEMLLRSGDSAAAMIDVGAFHLIHQPQVRIKQMILEEGHLEVRAEIFAQQLQTMIDSWHAARSGRGPNQSWPPPTCDN